MPADTKKLNENLKYLKLNCILDTYEKAAKLAVKNQFDPIDFLAELINAQVQERQLRASERRLRLAKLPVLKTLDQYNFTYPKKINQPGICHLFRLEFIKQKENVLFIGTTGLGKTHLAIALAYQACHRGYSVLFTKAVDMITHLQTAQKVGNFILTMKKYLKVQLLIIDELGYLTLDRHGANLLFQVISNRYEIGSIVLTGNRAFKQWPLTFDNDNTITSAILDRLLHHAHIITIGGDSYRMKEKTLL
jgi:DNA replication protein DnaC